MKCLRRWTARCVLIPVILMSWKRHCAFTRDVHSSTRSPQKVRKSRRCFQSQRSMAQCLYFFRYRTRDFQKMARKKSTSSRPCMTGRWRWAWHMRTSLLMVLLPRSEQIRKPPENVMRPLHTVKMCASFRPSVVCPIFHLDCRSVCMSTQHS